MTLIFGMASGVTYLLYGDIIPPKTTDGQETADFRSLFSKYPALNANLNKIIIRFSANCDSYITELQNRRRYDISTTSKKEVIAFLKKYFLLFGSIIMLFSQLTQFLAD